VLLALQVTKEQVELLVLLAQLAIKALEDLQAAQD
jgi:hypothetical protein